MLCMKKVSQFFWRKFLNLGFFALSLLFDSDYIFWDRNTADVTWCPQGIISGSMWKRFFCFWVILMLILYECLQIPSPWIKLLFSLCTPFANTWRLCKCTFAHQPEIARLNISWFIAAFYCFSNFIIPSPFISWQYAVRKSFLISLIYLFIQSFIDTSTNPAVVFFKNNNNNNKFLIFE